MGKELNIKTTADKKALTELSQSLGVLVKDVRILELELKQGKINSVDFAEGLTRIREKTNLLTEDRRKALSVNTALYNAEQRANNALVVLPGLLNQVKSSTGAVTPAMIAFTQVIQDAPYGIMGIGNNIEMLTQRFTALQASGMSATTILKGMLSTLSGPMGFLFAVSVVTSLATVFRDKLTPSVKETNNELDEQIKKWERLQELRFLTGGITPEERRAQLEAMVSQTQAELDAARKGTTTTTYSRFTGRETTYTPADPKVLMDLETKAEEAKQKLLDFDKKQEKEEEKIYEVVEKRLKVLKDMKDVGDLTTAQYVEQLRSILQQEISSEQSYQIRKEILDIQKETADHAAKALPTLNKLEKDRYDIVKLQYETKKISLEQFIREAETARALMTDEEQRLRITKDIQEIQAKEFKSKFHKVEGVGGNISTHQMLMMAIRDSENLTIAQEALVDSILTGVNTVASTIQDQVGQAWERTFGKARSLMQSFVVSFTQAIAGILVLLGAKYALSAIPGLGFLNPFSTPAAPTPAGSINGIGGISSINSISQSARFGGSSGTMQPVFVISNKITASGLATYVEKGNRINRSGIRI